MPNSLGEKHRMRFRDRDIFRDHQNRLFVVLGFIQPHDRVLSYLKYIPDKEGTWKTEAFTYRRLFWGSVDSALEGAVILPGNYIVEDNHFGTKLVEPSLDVIAERYNPEKRLEEILESPKDSLEELTKQATEFLHDEMEISIGSLGVAGSILWKGHSPTRSDVNMNIYGYEAAWALIEKLESIEGSDHQARLRCLPEWKHAIKRVADRIPVLGQSDLQALFTRRNALCVEDRCIGITPVLYTHEAPITHGTESYTSVTDTPIRFRATIEDADYSIFHPAIYGISPVAYNEVTVSRIMVYDGAFGGLFRTGDSVEVSGTLQRVTISKDNTATYQAMIGTKTGSGMEYIRFV